MAVDVTNWDEDEYRESILKEREIQTRTVFRTIWAPSPNSDPDTVVVAASDGSVASYSISSCISKLQISSYNAKAYNCLMAVPHCYLQGHDGPAYDIKFYDDGDNTLLLSCGDDGRIRGWRWNECTVIQTPNSSGGHNIETVVDLLNPQHKGPWGALSPIPENNAIAIDTKGRSIFAAAGDSCAYCWDVETGKIKVVFKGHKDYLHCIVARNSSNQIITGSEDGTARIWDVRHGKCTRVIEATKDKKSERFFSCVRCLALDASESWLVCGNGPSISVWNLSSSECISRILTRSFIQDVAFDDNQILAVGAEPSLTRFNMNGTILSQIQCAPQSGFSIAPHPSGVTAVGGYGGVVDIISQFGSHLCTFCCKYE